MQICKFIFSDSAALKCFYEKVVNVSNLGLVSNEIYENPLYVLVRLTSQKYLRREIAIVFISRKKNFKQQNF